MCPVFAVPVLAALGLFAAAVSAQVASAPATREVLATGSFVPRLGRVGIYGFVLNGIDDRGRLLLYGGISDGRVGLFWANGETISTAWSSDRIAEYGVELNPYEAGTSPNGQILVAGRPATGPPGRAALYIIDGRRPREVVAVGDVGPAGEHLCEVRLEGHRPVRDINRVGTIAFWATSVAADQVCESSGDDDAKYEESLYVATGERLTRVLRLDDPFPAGSPLWRARLIGLADDDTVLFEGGRRDDSSAIFSSKDGQTSVLLQDGDLGPSGEALRGLRGLSTNGVGETLFVATEGEALGLYRSDEGRMVLVTSLENPSLDPVTAMMNDSGHAAVSGREEPESGNASEAWNVVLFRGVDRQVIRGADGGVLNDHGDLAYVRTRFPTGPPTAMRLRNGKTIAIVANGDRAPGDGYFGAQGLGQSSCMSLGGLVVSNVYGADYREGLVCADGSGSGLIAAEGDISPEGDPFTGGFGACEFVSDGEILFAAGKVVLDEEGRRIGAVGLYRATAAGITAVIPGGSPSRIGDFAANRNGKALVYTDGAAGGTFIRAGRGNVESLPLGGYRFAGGRSVSVVTDFGITDQDDIVAAVRLDGDGDQPRDEGTAIVTFHESEARIVATADELPGGPFNRLDRLDVAGNEVVFAASLQRYGDAHLFQFRADRDLAPRAVLADDDRFSSPVVIDFTAQGRILFAAALTSDPRSYREGTFLLSDGELTLLLDDQLNTPPGTAVSLNDTGNVVFHSYRSPLGGFRESLSLSGPPTSARCSFTGAAATADGGRGCAILPNGTTQSPLAIPAGLFVLLCARIGRFLAEGH